MKNIKDEMESLAMESFQSLKEAGFESAQWLAAGDGDECDACRAADGTVVKLASIKVPWHETCENDYCRCTLIAAEQPYDEA